MTDIQSSTQWRVTWFPPGNEVDGITRTGNERQVRKMADLYRDFAPSIERREIFVGDWIAEGQFVDADD